MKPSTWAGVALWSLAAGLCGAGVATGEIWLPNGAISVDMKVSVSQSGPWVDGPLSFCAGATVWFRVTADDWDINCAQTQYCHDVPLKLTLNFGDGSAPAEKTQDLDGNGNPLPWVTSHAYGSGSSYTPTVTASDENVGAACADDTNQSDSATLNRDTTGPSVSITYPSDGACLCAGGQHSVAASATDAQSGIEKVVFSYSGPTSGSIGTDTYPPGCSPDYCVTWNTGGLQPGVYTLTATAYDNCGSSNSASVQVTLVSIAFSPDPVSVKPGGTAPLTATVTPTDATSCVAFDTANSSIATVSGTAPNLTVSGVAVGATQVHAEIGGSVCATGGITVADILVEKVAFWNTSTGEMSIYDAKTLAYVAAPDSPEWIRSPAKNEPAGYVRGANKYIKVKVTLSGPANKSAKVKAVHGGATKISEKQVTFDGAGSAAEEFDVVDPLQNAVDVWQPIWEWHYRDLDGCGDTPTTATSHTIYVTLAAKTGMVDKDFKTILKMTCTVADGATDATAVFTAVWNKISSRSVQRWDGEDLRYYGDWGTGNLYTKDLIHDADGQCGAWADFMQDSLGEHGISSTITDVELKAGYGTWILVKNWTFSGSGTSGDPDWPYKFPSEVTDQTGVSGQSTANPLAQFIRHYIITYGSDHYDPSYGNGPYGQFYQWEDASLDGFADDRAQDVAKKDVKGSGDVGTYIP
jgi:hypothetical protein